MQIIAVEANIGAGKSYLLPNLVENLKAATGRDWQIILEPVDQDPEFHRLLKDFIGFPTDADKRVRFQMYVTSNRQALLKNLPEGNYVIERSLFSDLVFSQVNFLSTERPSAIYMDYYYNIKKCLKDYPKIDALVYIDRSPEDCLESCNKRAREGESGYDIEYFRDLKRFHDACLPQIAREYDTPLVNHKVLTGLYADPVAITLELLHRGIV